MTDQIHTNRVKFTVGRISAFKCSKNKNEQLLWDTDEKTLCIRARLNGGKSYYYQSRLNKKVIKIKIGDLSDKAVTISYARKKAREFQNLVDNGIDPRLEIQRSLQQEEVYRKQQEVSLTRLIDIWNAYIDSNKTQWSTLHLNDHYKAMASPGRKRSRSSEKTTAGVLHQLRNKTLNQLTSQTILNWINKEKVNRPTVTARGYRLLRACLNWANTQESYAGILDTNALFRNREIQKALPKPNAKNDALEKSQLPLWFKTVKRLDNIVISAYLQTLLLTGARREELASLKWEDVDFQWKSIRLKDKVENDRIIPLTPYVSKIIQELPRRNEWVFSSPQSKSGRLKDPYRSHSKALSQAGLPHISIHGLRRSFGSLSEWIECPVGIVAQIQGHKPSAIAEKHYRVRPLDLLRVWHNKIEKQILEFAEIDINDSQSENIVKLA